jgi:hypothetical protein
MGGISRDKVIAEILDRELQMFLSVNARETASCQERPDDFRFYRGCMYSVWSLETLLSYRDDLERAGEEGRNLVELKYARMEDLIPPLNDNGLIPKIVAIEIEWTRELARSYPHIHKRGRAIEDDTAQSVSTKTYLQGELETYSDKTLELYYRNLEESLARGDNLALKILGAMAGGAGYSSLEEAEEFLAKKDRAVSS